MNYTKAYASILYETKFIPVATPFDEFEKYKDEDIIESNIYMIELNFSNENKILLDTTKRVICGVNLLKVKKYQKVKILSVCKLNKVQNNDVLPPVMDEIKNFELKEEDKKFIPNKNIGITGKRYSQGYKSGLYDNEEEANMHLENSTPFYPKHVRDTELWYIEQGEKKQLKNGFYLIQALIYDTMRTKLFVLQNELKEQRIQTLSVKTDCLFVEKMPDTSKLSFTIGKNWGEIKPIKKDYFKGENRLAMHTFQKECCDKCLYKCSDKNVEFIGRAEYTKEV